MSARPGNGPIHAQSEIQVKEINAFKTRSGNTRFVVVDETGKEYSTFKEQIVVTRCAGSANSEGISRCTLRESERSRFGKRTCKQGFDS